MVLHPLHRGRVAFEHEPLVAALVNEEHVTVLDTLGALHVRGHVEEALAEARDLARTDQAYLDALFLGPEKALLVEGLVASERVWSRR
jgi:hypothetical protein